MTTSMLDAQWTTDPTQPGRIAAGEAITIDVRVAFWRVPGGPAEEMRLLKEAETLVVAAPAMARALHAFLSSGLNARWVDDETGETVNVRKMAEQAYALTGLPLP